MRSPCSNEIIFSVIVVARNESEYLGDLLIDLASQDFTSHGIEYILVNSASEDNTKDIMDKFARDHNNARVFDNPRRILAAGWNIGIKASRGQYVVRLDAHARVPNEFLSKIFEQLKETNTIVGGQIVNVRPEGLWKQTISLAVSSRFGCAAAAFRRPGVPSYVDTLAYAAYPRRVFDDVGLFDERLVRTEDNDMHYRIRRAGLKFFYHPAIVSYYVPRSSLRRLLKQMYGNGLWISLTMAIQPKCFSWRHFAPFLFVASLLIAAVGSAMSVFWPLISMVAAYYLGALAAAIIKCSSLLGCHRLVASVLPLHFSLIHISYGLGTLVGLVKLPSFARKSRLQGVSDEQQ